MADNVKFLRGQKSNLPSTGDKNNIYVTTDTHSIYLADQDNNLRLANAPVTRSTGENSIIGNDVNNNIASSEHTSVFGTNNKCGLRGYYWSDIDIAAKTIKISKSHIDTTAVNCEYEIGDVISIVNNYRHEECSKIINKSIDTSGDGNDILTVDNLPFSEVATDYDEAAWSRFCIYCPAKPTVGAIDLGKSSVVFGENNTGSNWCTFVSGKSNKALGQYAFVAGNTNKSGYAAMTTGRDNNGMGQYGFTTGQDNINTGRHCAVFGYKNKCDGVDESKLLRNLVTGQLNEESGKYNLTSGYANKSSGQCNVIGGWDNTVTGEYNVVGGVSNNVSSANNNISGKSNTITNSKNCVVSGSNNKLSNSDCSVLGGSDHTVSSAGWSQIQGYKNKVSNGYYTNVMGAENVVDTDSRCAFVHGDKNIVSSKYGFVAGYGNNINSSARNSFCFGQANTISFTKTADGDYGFAIGRSNNQKHRNCFLIGDHLSTTDENQTRLGYYSNDSTAPFVIGNGTSDDKSNLIEIYKDEIVHNNHNITANIITPPETVKNLAQLTNYMLKTFYEENIYDWVKYSVTGEIMPLVFKNKFICAQVDVEKQSNNDVCVKIPQGASTSYEPKAHIHDIFSYTNTSIIKWESWEFNVGELSTWFTQYILTIPEGYEVEYVDHAGDSGFLESGRKIYFALTDQGAIGYPEYGVAISLESMKNTYIHSGAGVHVENVLPSCTASVDGTSGELIIDIDLQRSGQFRGYSIDSYLIDNASGSARCVWKSIVLQENGSVVSQDTAVLRIN